MKFKLSDLVRAQNALRLLGAQTVPVVVGDRVARFNRKTAGDIQAYQESHNKLIMQYGQKDEQTGNYTIASGNTSADNIAAFNAEMKPILDQEITCDVQPLKLDDLGTANVEGIGNILTDLLGVIYE